MSDTYDPWGSNSGPIDPYLQLALMQQVMPEYSVSKGWQPIDQGTMRNQVNYNQDLWQNWTDPIMGAMSGAYDPAAFEPTVDDSNMPERPDLGQLDLYRSSNDPIMAMVIQGLSEGRPPYDVIETLKENELIPKDQEVPQQDGSVKRVEDPRAEALRAEATALQTQIAAENQYNSAMETYQPTTKPSDTAQKFIDAGLPLPTEKYTVDTLAPELAGMTSTREGLDSERDALYQQLEGLRSARGVERAGGEQDRSGPWGRALDSVAGVRDRMPEDRSGWSQIGDTMRGLAGVGRPEKTDRSGWGKLLDTVNAYNGRGTENTRTGKSTADQRMRSQRDYVGAANRAANAQLAELLTRAQARASANTAQAQGRTPFMDAIMQRALHG